MTTILLKKQVYSLGKLNRKELYNILTLRNYKNPASEGYFESFFESLTIDGKDTYLLPHKTTISAKHRSFQYNFKLLFNFGKVKSPLCSFCKSAEETIINLFSEYLVHNIYGIKLKSFFQDILLSLVSHGRVPFLVLQTPALNTFY